MVLRIAFFLCLPVWLVPAAESLLIRTTEGKLFEGQTALRSIKAEVDGKAADFALAKVAAVFNGADLSDQESALVKDDLAAVQGTDRKQRDRAVEELTSIGVPVATPLLRTLKDTDQHEPRPLYRLFEKVMPSNADELDRSLSLIRLRDGQTLRGKLTGGTVELRSADGKTQNLSWANIRSLAVRQKMIQKTASVHSLRHCTQIEYLDTGIVLTPESKLTSDARGFVRLSWDTDGWATDADGLKKPGSPAYKTNLVDGHPFGALVGRSGSAGETFLLGKKTAKSGLPAGRLALAVNDNGHWQNNVGTYTVVLNVSSAYDVGDPQ